MSKLTQLFSKLVRNIPEGHHYYDGHYHDGTAQYVYVLSNGEKIFDGDFQYKMRYENGGYETAQGPFVLNRKNGNWHFERRTSRTIRKLDIRFLRGHVTGTVACSSEELGINASSITGISLTADDNKVTGQLEGTFDGGDFVGYCDAEGYPDGEWTLEFYDGKEKKTVQCEVWEHGTLKTSYEEDVVKGKKTEKAVRLREKLNFLLDDTCARLLSIVRRGTVSAPLHVPSRK